MTDASVHAELSPSGAYRWFECPGSVQLCARIPRRSSVYAAEGTAAHMIAARCLQEQTDAVFYLDEELTVEGQTFVVTEGMAEAIQVFLDLVRSYTDKGYVLQIEVKLDLGHLWEGQFGTGDAILYHPLTEHLVVVDYKHGSGVAVSAVENKQLLSYASGAYHLYADRGVTQVHGIIVQPRVGGEPVRPWQILLERLEQFEREFTVAAEKAMAVNAPLAAGVWCKFCAGAGVCPALRDQSLKNALVEFGIGQEEVVVPPPVEQLTSAELGLLLQQITLIEHWLTEVKSEGLRRALAGDMPDGCKLVRKRTLRKWLDEPRALAALTMVYDLAEDDVYTKKLISPAAAEKLLGKGAKAILEPMVVKPDGDLQLVSANDKREAVPADAAVEFAGLLLHQLEASARAVEGAD